MEKTEAIVIGAGVVGLACARALAQRGIATIIVERHDAFGTETSARNSEAVSYTHLLRLHGAMRIVLRLCDTG